MRKLVLTAAVLIIGAGAYAQTDSANNRMNEDGKMIYDQNQKNDNGQITQDNRNSGMSRDKSVNNSDGYMMQNGKLMMMKDGKMTVVEKDVTLTDGTTIMSNGTYMKKDGTKVTLKNGERIDMTGKLNTTKSNNDKDMYLVPDSTRK